MNKLIFAGVLELVDEVDSKASTPAVCLTLDFSMVLRYDDSGRFESSLLGSLPPFKTGESQGSETVGCAQPRAGVMELVDVADSKSAGLIPRVGSSPTTGTKRTEQFRCRGLNAYGINCFRAFHPLKFLKPNDRCQQAILSVWQYLNPHTTNAKKGAKLNWGVTQPSGKGFFSLKCIVFRAAPFFI